MRQRLQRIISVLVVLSLILTLASVTFAQQRTHTVQAGETLYSIARRYSVSVNALAAANGITNPALIYVGQVLVIPGTAPAPTQPPAPTSSGQRVTYTVQAGDTLFRIALRFGTTVDELMRLNGITNADRISVGQVLIIRLGSPTTVPTTGPSTNQPTAAPTAIRTPTTAPTQPAQDVTYTVQVGDTLGSIAVRFGTTYQQIALLNGLTNPDLIYPGQVLIIRRGTVTATPTTPTAAPTTAVPTTAVPATTAAPGITPTRIPSSATPTPVPPTAAASNTPGGAPTPTQIVPDGGVPANAPNRLTNPGFEGNTRAVGSDSIIVFDNWNPFFCDQPYTPQRCPALRQGSGNAEGLLMGTPEFKSIDIATRVHSGSTAQHFYCWWKACQGGVYQTVNTTPGATCVAGAFVQSWSSNGTSFTSDLQTFDQRANSTWFIRVDPNGGTNAFANGVLISRGFGYFDDIYDQYVEISYLFTATSATTTVFFENLRLWPVSHNDNFIDDAYIRCTQ